MSTVAGGVGRERTKVRPTAFGVVVTALVVVAAIIRPPVADPSVVGLVWAGLVGALVFGVVWPVVAVRSLRVHVTSAPTDLVVDQLGTLELALTGRASGLTLACSGQAMTVVDIVSPSSVRLPVSVTHRGAYRRIRVDVGSDAPFGIVSATRTRLVDLPRLLLVGPLSEDSTAHPGELPGEDAAPRPAGAGLRGDAVRSVRPYTTGDPSHLVHWPSTARTGALVVRELEPPAAEALAIVVDLRDGDDEAVESAASLAAGLAESAFVHGARVLMCTAEESGPVVGEVGDLLAVRRRLALAVAGAPPEPPDGWPVTRLQPGARTARPATSPVPGDPSALVTTIAPDDPAAGDGSGPHAAPRRRSSADRHTITTARVWALTALVGLQLYSALSALPNTGSQNLSAEAAALCAVLAMFGLRSVPIRWIVRGLTVVSGLLLARFGELGALEGLSGSRHVLVWLAATAAALALAPSSRAIPGAATGIVVNAADLPSHGAGSIADDGASVRPARAGTVPIALVFSAVTLIGASALLVGPRMGATFPVGAAVDDVVDFSEARSGNALVAADSLDMTSRPRLSDRVVMSVRSPIATFWRTEVYDEWDGSRWTRSYGRSGGPLTDGRIVPDQHDVAATAGVPSTQEFRLEAGFATAVPAAASAVHIDGGDVRFVQRSDGTILSPFRPLGAGTTYRVRSRQMHVDERALRSSARGSVPPELAEQYATPSVVTDRVDSLARAVTARATNDYDRIRMIEQWMGTHTEYSLDAPLSPEGVDVVDHFLFESQLGWCEQIASSLVVMARSAGVPARLAAGFAPGEWDSVGNRFVVREREAHAWAEVWFPDIGWVPFDPTADVPLAGSDEAAAGAAARDWRETAGTVLLVAGLVSLSAGWVRRTVERWFRRYRSRATRRRLLRERWDVADEDRIERAGAAAGRVRTAGETITAYAAQVADSVGDPSLPERAARIDRERYATASDTHDDGSAAVGGRARSARDPGVRGGSAS